MLLPYARGYLSNGKEIHVYEGMFHGFGKNLLEDEYVLFPMCSAKNTQRY